MHIRPKLASTKYNFTNQNIMTVQKYCILKIRTFRVLGKRMTTFHEYKSNG